MYSQQTLFLCVLPLNTTGLAPKSLVASTGVFTEWIALKRFVVKRLECVVTTLTATSTANPVITFRLRPTIASSSSQSTIGTLTIPTGSAVGKVIYKDIQNLVVPVGYSVAIDLSTAGTDASAAAGAGICGFEAVPSPEDKANETNMVASA